jgi:hypothetical protein
MKKSDIKDLIISSLDEGADAEKISARLEDEGVEYSFNHGLADKVLDHIFLAGAILKRETDFVRNLNFAFRSIALSGVAAIIFLIISIFIMEGKISVNSFLGLKDNYDESIVCLLTGN